MALLDRSDRWHERCAAAFQTLHLPLATSIAVLAELFHFLDHPKHQEAAWGLLRHGAIVVLPILHADLPAIQALMDRYRDRPMDFADATLVHLAEREGLSTIFTVDHADFETYHLTGRRRFSITPARG